MLTIPKIGTRRRVLSTTPPLKGGGAWTNHRNPDLSTGLSTVYPFFVHGEFNNIKHMVFFLSTILLTSMSIILSTDKKSPDMPWTKKLQQNQWFSVLFVHGFADNKCPK